MERDAMGLLVEWRESSERKPLILRGARQVGKTWLLNNFGEANYANVAYFNFEQRGELRQIFAGDLVPERLLASLRAASAGPIEPGKTLIVFDEVQEAPRALTALKYFNEQANDYHIACAGSLLGVAIHEAASFPVGKVSFLDVYPLSFAEYLRARGLGNLADLLASAQWELIAAFHERLLGLLREYFVVGGMPAAVASFADKQDWVSARAIQDAILDSYDRDFSKHVPVEQLPKVRDVWAAIPGQLGKEKKRFKYTDVSPGSRARTYESAIGWLTQAGLACRVDQISAPRLPLASYADERGFKLYQLDVGLLGAQSKLDPGVVVQGDTLFTEFKGSLAEQFVASHLVGALGSRPYYWVSQGTAEVDFVVQLKNQVVPIEVKSGGNVKAKSLAVYRSRYAPKSAVRLSPLPYRAQDGLVNLPLYAVQHLPSVLS